MTTMMMARMDAAAAATAAMGARMVEPGIAAAFGTPTPTLIQSLYPVAIGNAPYTAVTGEDKLTFRTMLELQSTQLQLQQPTSHPGYSLQSQIQYHDHMPQSEPLSPFASTITHTGLHQTLTKERGSGNQLPQSYVLSSENEDEGHSLSISGEEMRGGSELDAGREFKIEDLEFVGGMKLGKICRVCGDKALGYNFNVVSCESCKAFFRRNALKKKEFRCPFSDNCEVSVVSRRFCQKCRLRKCFDVGMKKEWIMSEEARVQKRARVEQNRRKRTSTASGQDLKSEDSASAERKGVVDDAPLSPAKKRAQTADAHNARPNGGLMEIGLPQTPAIFSLGGAFSPPGSNSSSKSSVSPMPQHPKVSELGQDEADLVRSHNMKSAAFVSGLSHSQSYNQAGPTAPQPPAHGQDSQQRQSSLAAGAYPGPPSDLTSSKSVIIEKPFPAGTIAPFLPPASNNYLPYSFVPVPSFDVGGSIGAPPLDFGFGTSPIGPRTLGNQNLEDSITIPKAVLISLINQCHIIPSAHDLAKARPPPIVVRAERLVDRCSDEDMAECICRCACGARSANARIGVRKADKCVGPGSGNEEEANTAAKTKMAAHGFSKPAYKRDVSCSMNCSIPIDHPSSDWTNTFALDTGDPRGAVPASVIKSTWSFGQLNAHENWKLRELYAANRIMMDPLDQQEENNWKQMERLNQTLTGDDYKASSDRVTDTIHLTDICVRRIIKMCKRISAFLNICQEDQIALLKGGCTELMLLRGVMTFIPEKESWRPVGCKDTLLSLQVLKTVKGNVYEKHRKFLSSFREEWRRSDAVMLTLAAITLFNPRRQNLACVQAVQMEQEAYKELLKHYLDIMYGADTLASVEAYRELLIRVEDVKRLNDYAATIFLEVNPTDVEPLLIEIFDLK